jgi:phosphate transport system substrate-binding protein
MSGLARSAQTHADNRYGSGPVVRLVGAGSTFDAPFFQKAFGVYMAKHPVTISYRAVGSGGGIQQFSKGLVDFGASDVPMNDAELQAAQTVVGPVVQAPIALGGIAIAYNLPSIAVPLQLDGPTLAQIFLGKITRWNDAAIKKLNPSLTLPNLAVTPVHRSDSSGTTYITTDYLSTVSSPWQTGIGTAKSVAWPTGVGGNGYAGVAAAIQQRLGAVGYIELDYALTNHISYAKVKNRFGYFVWPTVATVRTAAAQRPYISATDFSIVNALGVGSYPIAGYSWVLLPERPKANDLALIQLFRWLAMDGQKLNTIPLPYDVQEQSTIILGTVQ